MTRAADAAVAVLALVGLTACGPEDADAPGTSEQVEAATGATASTDPGLASAAADVERLAVGLESFLRGGTYPRDVAGAVAALDDAGLEVSDGNEVATYVYDEEAVELRLCVEAPGGAWATYDTAPMSVREAGETGGCPEV